MDKFSAMQAFVRVVEAGTFTQAAVSLQLPKPTVTRLVQTLEEHLQTKLLNRTTRQVTVTPDGAAYYDRAVRLLSEMDELESSMSHAKANPRGRLRIDVPSEIGRMVIVPALPQFYARYPDIQIDLGVSDRPVDLLSDNVDCVLRGGELLDQSLVARRLGELLMITCATPDYVKRHGMPRHPRDLETGHTLVAYMSHTTGRVFPFTFLNMKERLDIHGSYMVSVNDAGAYVAAGLAGLGIMSVPTFTVQKYIANGELVPMLLDWCTEPIPLHVVYPPNRHLSNKVRVFVDWVAELFANSDLIQRRSTLPGMQCPHEKAAEAMMT
jgi:LysR family transcriptional regulator for bpeEF and oprC